MPAFVPLVFLLLVLGLLVLHIVKPSTRSWVWKVQAGIALAMFGLQPYLGLSWVPPEQFMGDVYRIIYMHVPQVWAAMLALILNFGCSVAFLFKRSFVTDSLAEASAEVGVFFGTIGVLLGAIWAKPTWGVYWTWDPRLTTAAIMLVVYAGYLTLRRFIEDPDKRATFSAALGILAAVDLPVLWFSVKWWKSLHQVQSNPKTVDPNMATVLYWSGVAFLALLFVFIYQRFLIAQADRQNELAPPEAA